MPARSKAQLRAMYAAASGHSTLGIPASIGKEFVQATPKAQRSSLMEQVKSHLTKRGRLRRGD